MNLDSAAQMSEPMAKTARMLTLLVLAVELEAPFISLADLSKESL